MPDNPTPIILGAVVIATGTTIIRNAHNKTKAGTTFKPIVYGFLVALSLLAIGLVAPGFAKGLALMVLVGAFVLNGPAIASLGSSLKKGA